MLKYTLIPIILIYTLSPINAYAAEILMPIKVKIVQCGTRAEAIDKCRSGEEVKCCVFE